MMTDDDALAQYAEQMAGRPGAIFVGDINQLVGPAPMTLSGEPDADLGDSEGNVPPQRPGKTTCGSTRAPTTSPSSSGPT